MDGEANGACFVKSLMDLQSAIENYRYAGIVHTHEFCNIDSGQKAFLKNAVMPAASFALLAACAPFGNLLWIQSRLFAIGMRQLWAVVGLGLQDMLLKFYNLQLGTNMSGPLAIGMQHHRHAHPVVLIGMNIARMAPQC